MRLSLGPLKMPIGFLAPGCLILRGRPNGRPADLRFALLLVRGFVLIDALRFLRLRGCSSCVSKECKSLLSLSAWNSSSVSGST